jgi:two-component system nitrogen regulation response regulator GlnG
MKPAISEISSNTRGIFSLGQVLIVDDEALIRWALTECFSSAGYDVSEAADGATALARLREGHSPIDIVVLEVNLPDASGIDLLKQINRLCPTCRVILMTAFVPPDVLREACGHGAYDLLPKPFELDHMLDTAQRALRNVKTGDGANFGERGVSPHSDPN